MDLGNKAGFFRQAYVRGLFLLPLGLLGGCSHASRKEASPPPAAPQAVDIGVPACNAYLNRYLACHRAAHIFPADAETHYQAMLSSLQQSVADPKVRPYLAARCVGLRQELDAALRGQACTAPASAPHPASRPGLSAPVRTQN